MTVIDTLIDRNKRFADQHIHQSLSMMPKLKTMIIGCVDPRVDPAEILGLEPGEAIVIRNVGGRVTPSAMQTLGLLGMVSPGTTSNSGQPWNLIVLHHTDCGIRRIENNAPDMLAGFFGIPKEQLDSKAVNDPRAAVMIDVAALKANPVMQRGFVISGMVYDVDTGLVEVVVPPAS